jgi:hypothetical protein
MKRIYVLAALCALIFGAQLLVTCSNPLERDDDPDPSPPIIDTIIEFDTIFLVDTVSGIDTLIIHDTTTITDTLTVVDTIELSDTVIVVDTLIEGDTIIVVDTITTIDSIIIVDTLIQLDTVVLIDTVTSIDTLTVVDTLLEVDTLIVVDTLLEVDTLIVVDTLLEVDTLIFFDTIVVPDSTCIQTICDTLSNYNQMIFWTFGNMAGTYLLTFEATIENNQPPKELIVTIDGEEYIWHTDQSLVFTIEATLDEYSTIKIHPDKPMAFGHYVYVCLTFGTP